MQGIVVQEVGYGLRALAMCAPLYAGPSWEWYSASLHEGDETLADCEKMIEAEIKQLQDGAN